jgi:hypothetical protein
MYKARISWRGNELWHLVDHFNDVAIEVDPKLGWGKYLLGH